ncbi:MAG: hypothetical protein AB1742_04170 [bacterium]
MAVEWNRPKPGNSYALNSFNNFDVTYKMTEVDAKVTSGDDLKIVVNLYKRTPSGWGKVPEGCGTVEFSVR